MRGTTNVSWKIRAKLGIEARSLTAHKYSKALAYAVAVVEMHANYHYYPFITEARLDVRLFSFKPRHLWSRNWLISRIED